MTDTMDSSKVVIYIFLGFFSMIFGCALVLFFSTVILPIFMIDGIIAFFNWVADITVMEMPLTEIP